MTAPRRLWVAGRHGLAIRVRLTPRATRDAVDGVTAVADGMAVAARVRAIPEKGAANAALERLVAGWLEVPVSSVAVTAGSKSRVKTVEIAGDSKQLECRVEAAVAALRS